MICYTYHTEILTLNMQNVSAMKSSLFSRNVCVMFTGQTPLSKGNFPFNLDNTLSIVQFPFRNKHGQPEQCSSKFPDLVLDINDNYFLQSYI